MPAGAPDGVRPCVLVFAGADPSGGAGLAADILAIHAQGAHALPVVTALTVQDNERVHDVLPVDADVVLRQARALTARTVIAAVKIGIPGSAANAQAIAQVLHELRAQHGALPVVLDPVLASGHGDLLSRGDAAAALAPLLALATVLTPNGPEARALAAIAGADAVQAARALHARSGAHVLLTGGHEAGEGAADDVVNRWFAAGCERSWRWPRLPGAFHGSGCTLAAALAAQLAAGVPLAQALERAQRYCHGTLAHAFAIAPGQRIPLR